MIKTSLKYLVIEDDTNVWNNIEYRMRKYPRWSAEGFCSEVEESLEKIRTGLPDLIFMDWSIRGGDAYDILDEISEIPSYRPYVIFFTGFQSDHPEIPEKILTYPIIKKYIIKPIFEKLSLYLDQMIIEAEELHEESLTDYLWICDLHKNNHKVLTKNFLSITQNPSNPRTKILKTSTREYEIKITWEECLEILQDKKLIFCYTKQRKSIVNCHKIIKLNRPFIWLENNEKIEVSRERWDFIRAYFESVSMP